MPNSHNREAAQKGTPRGEMSAYRLVEELKSGRGFALSGTQYTELYAEGFGALFEDGSFLMEVLDASPEMIALGHDYQRVWLVGHVADGHVTSEQPVDRAGQAKS